MKDRRGGGEKERERFLILPSSNILSKGSRIGPTKKMTLEFCLVFLCWCLEAKKIKMVLIFKELKSVIGAGDNELNKIIIRVKLKISC